MSVFRHAIQSVPISEDGLQEWCRKRWQEKEQTLKRFYKHSKFVNPASSSHNAPLGDGEPEPIDVSANNEAAKEIRVQNDAIVRQKQMLAIIFWLSFLCIVTYFSVFSFFAQCWSLAFIAFFCVMTHKYGGLDNFQVKYYNYAFRAGISEKKRK